jgi:hypothetical protein
LKTHYLFFQYVTAKHRKACKPIEDGSVNVPWSAKPGGTPRRAKHCVLSLSVYDALNPKHATQRPLPARFDEQGRATVFTALLWCVRVEVEVLERARNAAEPLDSGITDFDILRTFA